jgi:predicted Na+-dependent transporter
MQPSGTVADRDFILPRWVRISAASFILFCAFAIMWKHFFRFEWITEISFGIYFLVYWPRKRGEALGEYFRHPRAVLTVVLLVVVIGSSLRFLYLSLIPK